MEPKTPEVVTPMTFDDAFAESLAIDAPGAKAPETPAVETKVEEQTPPAGEIKVEGEQPPVVEVPPVVEESADTKIARLEAENAAFKAQKPPESAPVTREETPPATPQNQIETPPAEPDWYKFKPEEAAIIEKYTKEWPDIATAEELRIKQAVYNAVQYIFGELKKNYNPVLERFSEMSDTIAEQLTLSALRSEHDDYDAVYSKVEDWVKTLPTFSRMGAQQVMKEGTPEQVAELITTYKKTLPPAATPNAAPSAAPTRTTELSAPARKAAAALTVVGSKRTVPTTSVDQNDFDGGWAEALASPQ